MESVGGIPKETFRAASGLAAGVSRQGEVCGRAARRAVEIMREEGYFDRNS